MAENIHAKPLSLVMHTNKFSTPLKLAFNSADEDNSSCDSYYHFLSSKAPKMTNEFLNII